jgi:ferric-dicitrate binding protein FerR (iron transport regulator)
MSAIDEKRIEPTEEQRRSRRARNIALALALGGFAIFLWLATWAKLGANVLNRTM